MKDEITQIYHFEKNNASLSSFFGNREEIGVKRLSSRLAILGGGFSNVCFTFMHEFHTFEKIPIKYYFKITYLAVAWQSIKVITVTV